MMLHLDAPSPVLVPQPIPAAELLRGAALFLDFDGTLVEIADRPEDVIVDEDLRTLLRRLSAGLDGRVAIVSGRSVGGIDALLGPESMTVSGSHGAELRWQDGRSRVPAKPPWLARVRERMEALAARHEGVLVEAKPFGVALHYRLAPHAEAECMALAQSLAEHSDVRVQHGKMMVELRAAGSDKGRAVRAMMDDPSLAGATPVFIGDDVTDEDAFEAVEALGGAGILVGPPRPTAARYRLDSVDAARRWLGATGTTGTTDATGATGATGATSATGDVSR